MQSFDLRLPLDVIHVCQHLRDNDVIQMHTVNTHGEQVIVAVKKLSGTHWVNISFEGMGGSSIFEEISGKWSCQIDHLIVPHETDIQETLVTHDYADSTPDQPLVAYAVRLAENIDVSSTTKPMCNEPPPLPPPSKCYPDVTDKKVTLFNPVPCPHCSQLQPRAQLSKHIKYRCTANAARVKYLRCRICGYGTPHADKLAEHARTHADGRNYKCSMCTRSYVSKAGLTVHTRKKHAIVKRNPITYIECKVCGKLFMHKSRLDAHMNIHTGERRFACDVCGKTFNESGTMKSHRRTQHLKQYRYHCEICGHGVEKLRYLAKHRCRVNVAKPVNDKPVNEALAAKEVSPAKEVGLPPGNKISPALLEAIVQQKEAISSVTSTAGDNEKVLQQSESAITTSNESEKILHETESKSAITTIDEGEKVIQQTESKSAITTIDKDENVLQQTESELAIITTDEGEKVIQVDNGNFTLLKVYTFEQGQDGTVVELGLNSDNTVRETLTAECAVVEKNVSPETNASPSEVLAVQQGVPTEEGSVETG